MEQLDTDELLRLIRLTIRQMRRDEDPRIKLAHAGEIAEYFEALDEELSTGSQLEPAAWRRQ